MIGRVLGGRYQIQHRIGGGGMATVYRAVDTLLHRPVAVKILRPEFAGDDDFVRRFRREARAAASLSHPNVVAVYDVGREGDDTYFIVMEYVDGPTLKERIRDGGPLPPAEAARVAAEILEALDHAHQRGVVHRDVKPQNVLLTRSGHAKVADFGIARATTGASATHAGTVVGTAHYVSPEQARGQWADERSDVYSAGVVLYEMLTGRVPFDAEVPVAVALQHVRDEPLPPRVLNPQVPETLQRVVLRALAKEPERRYPSASAFRRDLVQALDGGALPAASGEVAAPPAPPAGQRPAGSDPSPRRAAGGAVPRTEGAARGERRNGVIGPASRGGARQEPGAGWPLLGAPARGEGGAQGDAPAEEQPTLVVGARPGAAAPRRRAVLARAAAALAVAAALLGGGGAVAFWGVGRWLRVPVVTVPDVRGMSVVQAQNALAAARLVPVVVATRYSDSVPVNDVIEVNPPPGSQVKAGRRIELTVSSGPNWVTGGVPDVSGQQARQAELALENAGLKWTEVHRHDDRVPSGYVVGTEPPAGSSVTAGSTVGVIVSDGPEPQPFALPDWTGQPLGDVTAAVAAQGLKLGSITQRLGSYPQGSVLDTSPKPGAVVRPGDTVDLVVSSGCEHTATVVVTVPPAPAPVPVEVFVVDAFTSRHRVFQGVRPPGSQVPVNVCWAGPAARWDATANGVPTASGVLP